MYAIEQSILEPVTLGPEDLVTQAEAKNILGVKQQTILNGVNSGRFSVVWDLQKRTGRTSARLLLRAEVEAGGQSLSLIHI